jgi:hypothetical protein
VRVVLGGKCIPLTAEASYFHQKIPGTRRQLRLEYSVYADPR